MSAFRVEIGVDARGLRNCPSVEKSLDAARRSACAGTLLQRKPLEDEPHRFPRRPQFALELGILPAPRIIENFGPGV